MSIAGLLKAYELERKILGIGEQKCSLRVIEAAERYLGVVFPPTYRYFLEHISLNSKADLLGLRLYEPELAISDQPVVSLTQTYREDPSFPLPQQYILIDDEAPDFMHILDTTQVDQQGECKVICWLADDFFDSDYTDLDGLYLELVNGAIYKMMWNKADEGKLLRQEVEDYIAFYKSLGYTGKEDRFLEKHWLHLFDMVS